MTAETHECSGNEDTLVFDEKVSLKTTQQHHPIIVDTSQIKEKSFINYFESSDNGGITFADIQRDIDLHCLRQTNNNPALMPGAQIRGGEMTSRNFAENPISPNSRDEAQRNWSKSFNREILAPCPRASKNNSNEMTNTLFSHASPGRGRGFMLAQHASRVGLAWSALFYLFCVSIAFELYFSATRLS